MVTLEGHCVTWIPFLVMRAERSAYYWKRKPEPVSATPYPQDAMSKVMPR